MTDKEIVYSQFFTKNKAWLKDHIKKFIFESQTTTAYDPFAGEGDLLEVAQDLGYANIEGLDLDANLKWKKNDSLLNIPHIDNAIIITNPPYRSNYSASRKKIDIHLKMYFDSSVYDDLYMIALDRMLSAQDYVVAIIPETFINSNYKQKGRLCSLTVLEDDLFPDTDTPILVACFDGKVKHASEISVYKNDDFVMNLDELENLRLVPKRNVDIKFNVKSGWLGIRCVDSTDPKKKLKFDFKENIDYDWENGIKVSSRLYTCVQIDVPDQSRRAFADECNDILNKLREKSSDLIFSPFKGNAKNGKRRRRLDFSTCRAIMERAYCKITSESSESSESFERSLYYDKY